MTTFVERLEARMCEVDSLACVGLDPVVKNMPAEFAESKNPLAAWSVRVIEQTHPFVCAFKLNWAFYEAEGRTGLAALEQTMEHLRSQHGDIPVIGDAKRGDIGSSSEAYARSLFDRLGFDAVTLNPYLGRDALEPFLRRADRGCIIVCRTSNQGADDFQNLKTGRPEAQAGDDPQNLRTGRPDRNKEDAAESGDAVTQAADGTAPLWQQVLRTVVEQWNSRGNCLAVIGATRPDDLQAARSLAGDAMTFLVPGIGAQGGDPTRAVTAGVNSQRRGVILSSSRSITSAPNPAAAAADLRERINKARQR